MNLNDYSLDDCGKVAYQTFGKRTQVPVHVIMVIKAGRGIMRLFDEGNVSKQCRAIQAFVEEHKDE